MSERVTEAKPARRSEARDDRRRWPMRTRFLGAGFWLLGCAVGASALAQALTPPAGGAYVLRKQVIAAGGQRVQGGAYVLTGTVGQALVDPLAATAASLRLTGGFHAPGYASGEAVFASGFEN